jgi:hypothetical protein
VFVEAGDTFAQPTSVRGFELTPLGVLPPEYPRRVGELEWLVGDIESIGFVSVGHEMSADHGPLCGVDARGPGAGAAIAAFADRLRSRRLGWSQVEGMPYDGELTPEFVENEQRHNDWVAQIRLDLRPESNSAFVERVPIWNEEEHPEEPSQAEIEAAENMSLEEAFIAAVFEIALPEARHVETSDPATTRRLRALGFGTVAGVYVMRMNGKGGIVGVEPMPDGRVTVSGIGRRASNAGSALRVRMSGAGWSAAPNTDSSNTTHDWCLSAPEGDLTACVVQAAGRDAIQLTLDRVG